MARDVLASRAARDIDEIVSHIRRDDPAAALHVLDEIERACSRLALHPRMGRLRTELAPRPRSFLLSPQCKK
ncbi:MAG: type II toxin-antitoxin system RelE/ParE family toxin [Pseudomonadota bacterium]